MSEFSESYHTSAQTQSEGEALLRRAQTPGFVFPPANGWVTVVPKDETHYGEPNDSIIRSSVGTLLYYLNAEDHGWAFTVYQDGGLRGSYECRWEDDVSVNDTNLDLDFMASVAASHGSEFQQARQELERLLHPPSIESVFGIDPNDPLANPGHLFAELLGLKHYSFIAPAYMKPTTTVKDGDVVAVSPFELYPGLIEV